MNKIITEAIFFKVELFGFAKFGTENRIIYEIFCGHCSDKKTLPQLIIDTLADRIMFILKETEIDIEKHPVFFYPKVTELN